MRHCSHGTRDLGHALLHGYLYNIAGLAAIMKPPCTHMPSPCNTPQQSNQEQSLQRRVSKNKHATNKFVSARTSRHSLHGYLFQLGRGAGPAAPNRTKFTTRSLLRFKAAASCRNTTELARFVGLERMAYIWTTASHGTSTLLPNRNQALCS